MANLKQNKSIPDQIRELVEKSGKSWYIISKETGLQPSTLQRVKDEGWGTQIETASKILSPLGYELTITKK